MTVALIVYEYPLPVSLPGFAWGITGMPFQAETGVLVGSGIAVNAGVADDGVLVRVGPAVGVTVGVGDGVSVSVGLGEGVTAGSVGCAVTVAVGVDAPMPPQAVSARKQINTVGKSAIRSVLHVIIDARVCISSLS